VSDRATEDLADTRVLDHVGVDQVVPDKRVRFLVDDGVDERPEIRLRRAIAGRRWGRRRQRTPAEPAVFEAVEIAPVKRMSEGGRGELESPVPDELEHREEVRRMKQEQLLGADVGQPCKPAKHDPSWCAGMLARSSGTTVAQAA